MLAERQEDEREGEEPEAEMRVVEKTEGCEGWTVQA